jgi:hypothetical protein
MYERGSLRIPSSAPKTLPAYWVAPVTLRTLPVEIGASSSSASSGWGWTWMKLSSEESSRRL